MNTVLIYSSHLWVRGGGEKLCLTLAASLAAAGRFDVAVITHGDVDRYVLSEFFNVNLSRVSFIRVRLAPLERRITQARRTPGLIRNVIVERAMRRAIARVDCDIFINHTHQSYVANPASTGLYMCMFPYPLKPLAPAVGVKKQYYRVMRWVIRFLLHPGTRTAIDSYSNIIAISEFTASHVQSMWNRASDLLYPPCEDMALENPLDKEKIILHVGRFFPDVGEIHHKRQNFLLETFVQMEDLIQDGWQLHLAGSRPDDDLSLAYYERLTQMGAGQPVTFHPNLTFEQLRHLYNRASIYWHATGYGVDATAHPEKQEHFGIVTVEAMSAGCIPVVINSAGQREIVEPGINGFVFDTAEQLMESTRLVAGASSDSLSEMRAAAARSAERFGLAAFSEHAVAVVESARDRSVT